MGVLKMELTLHTEGWYDASHALENYDGPCSNMHGHTYKVEVWVKGMESDLNEAGIMWDFGKLKKLTSILDHKCLNAVFNEIKKINSTAENQCLWFYNKLKEENSKLQFKVRIYEQLEPKKSYCECGDF